MKRNINLGRVKVMKAENLDSLIYLFDHIKLFLRVVTG